MRAVRFHGRQDIRLDEVDEPICGNGQVKVSTVTPLPRSDPPLWVFAAVVCTTDLDSAPSSHLYSDLHEYLAGPMAVPVTPHPITREQLPTTLGHEFSGTVEEIGAGVSGLEIGDCVAVRPNLCDGTCPRCLMGRPNCCDSLGFIGYSGSAGGLSEHVVVDQKHAFRLPKSMPLDITALVEPLAVAWHAVNRSPLQGTDTVLVVGAGPIGLAIIQVLKARGIEMIIVVEISEQRRQFARNFGASHALDPTQADAPTEIQSITGDAYGASIAFECSGIQAGLDTAMAGIRVHGTTVIVSTWGQKPVLDAFSVVLFEKHIIGAVVYEDGDFEAVIDAIVSGKIQPRPMITSKIRMEEVEKGFRALIREKDQHVKILVDIGA
ncbi:hypothetical protein N7492_006243 [Penicillium capsulatum]|uniref:Enoyl reductase (ER) domain-containing protein n=1 Tax=Penicillium capsulatum TaxID=69766 RepID=A0A9W9I6K3_9EURO|nr:hypothetical protein N7492_006243 [Penicillium capsulatum]KAJ6108895.1 hypothetical protein N7512_008732 [Penicillium capsulatum]